eukprot:6937237-Alexandrium_andersonii.AAC.1
MPAACQLEPVNLAGKFKEDSCLGLPPVPFLFPHAPTVHGQQLATPSPFTWRSKVAPGSKI